MKFAQQKPLLAAALVAYTAGAVAMAAEPSAVVPPNPVVLQPSAAMPAPPAVPASRPESKKVKAAKAGKTQSKAKAAPKRKT